MVDGVDALLMESLISLMKMADFGIVKKEKLKRAGKARLSTSGQCWVMRDTLSCVGAAEFDTEMTA